MRTPKEYTESLKNGIITDDMFADCLYSVNKRAKNFRDNSREQRSKYGRYADTDRNDEKKNEYYREKEFFLQFLKPVAIHKEFAGYERKRIYDYEPEYENFRDRFVWENHYYDEDRFDDVWFGDIELHDSPNYRYYLYYEVGSHSFHSPINEVEVGDYTDLPTKTLDDLITSGKDINDLLSMNFVNKVMLVLCSGRYDLQVGNKADPLPIIQDVPDFVKIPVKERGYVPSGSNIATIYGYYGREETPYEYVCHFPVKAASLEEAKRLQMNVTTKTTMKDALLYIDEHGNILDFASRNGIGVEKSTYIRSGMNDSEYKRLSRKMKVVGTRKSGSQWKNKLNEYDIKQYIKWRNTGVIE